MTNYCVLGTFRVINDGRDCTPGPPKLRQLLALLLICADHTVSLDDIVAELWDEAPPKTVVATVQTYVYQLRRFIERERLGAPGVELLTTNRAGYAFHVEPGELDAEVFRKLSCQSRRDLEAGRPGEAAAAAQRALDLWTGPAFAGVTAGGVLDTHAVFLDEQHQRTLELRLEADLELGRHRELVGELRYLVARHPLDEWFHGRLILALGRAGRRGEALQAYRNARKIFNDELGVEPSRELQQLHLEVLTSDRRPLALAG
ncbi:AfsR/SARP family transcriptional regulator [Nonomuraea sp. NPDC048916]|uniref:AfsR/SARP family transcriptional regulator n=1 Tax=Nonomuraea sp. NPDC048916 TaxID=3154232 RepID=UPI0033E6DCC0